MTQDTQLIYTDTTADLPASYDLPGALDLTIQSVVARIDGSGAAGSFIPALSVYSQDGRLMARVPSKQTYAPGDTGVVTWSPFLRRGVAGATPSATGQAWAWLAEGGRVITSGGGPKALFNTPSGANSDATILFADTVNGQITVLAKGLYVVQATVVWTSTFTAERELLLQFSPGNGESDAIDYVNNAMPLGTQDRRMNVTLADLVTVLVGGGSDFAAGSIWQNSGANRTCSAYLVVQRIGPLP